MSRAVIKLDRNFTVAQVPPRLFGSFVEHMGRCVYTGIYEPGHPAADEDGLRQDVLDLVRELGVTSVRYPGGNFVSGYRWEDGVGPQDQRPRRLDLAWHSIETNQFGLDEFMRWARKADVEPMLAVNLGTRGVQEAVDVLEYSNIAGGTALSDLRRSNGAKEPHNIRMWCLGNEMDGPWQTGHKTAEEYGRLAEETAKAMRMVQADLELVACGSSHRSMPTFGAWEATVLEHCYEQVDFISAHAYYYEEDGDLGSHLAAAVDMDMFIESVVATADSVRARQRHTKHINISFDEWNVWYQDRYRDIGAPKEWEEAPRVIEDEYNVADAVVVGNLLISLLRHCDRVTSACQAQLVNVIAPIRSEPGGPAWRQTIFHPFAQAAQMAKGEVLQVKLESPTYETAKFGEVPVVDAVVTHDAQAGELVLFAVNRNQSEPVDLEADLSAFGDVALRDGFVLADDDVRATNTQDAPDRVVPQPHGGAAVEDGVLRATLPPVSWNVLRVTVPTT